MDVTFESGDPEKPKGHALAYFRARFEPEVVYATYIIVLPVAMDFAKYVPPFLASHLGNMPLNDLSAFSLPPVPEQMASYDELRRLAEMRDDDLLYGGTVNSADAPELMQAVGELVQYYAKSWSDRAGQTAAIEGAGQESSSVNEVLYSLMSQGDRLAELSKLVGKLRFAVEGVDHTTTAETEEDIRILGRYLPENYNIPDLLRAVMDASARGAQLARLHLDRCYRLSTGDDAGARELEEKIEEMKASS